MLRAPVWRAQPFSIGCLADLRRASTNTGASAVTVIVANTSPDGRPAKSLVERMPWSAGTPKPVP
jgi:hypothetical protein